MSSQPKSSGELMQYLPAVFHEDPLLAVYLSAFEQVLLGAGDPHQRGLEATIAGVARYFTPSAASAPKEAPEEFLPWLAGWVAFGMRADLTVALQRNFLTRVVSLYKMRGTAESLKELLRIFTGGEPTILEGDDLADASRAEWNVDDGYKKWVDSKGDNRPEHAFAVLLSFIGEKGEAIQRKLAIAYALIELEKPAHTMFYLIPVFPSLTLPDFAADKREKDTDPKAHSRIGFDTLLGVRSSKQAEPRKKGDPNAAG